MSLREGLERIRDKYDRSSEGWRPDAPWPTEEARRWHDGYITALAECSLIAREALDPEAAAHSDFLSELAARGSDAEWFAETGGCGHCGMLAEDCVCTSDDPCGCGPHELRRWPKPCPWCDGSGQIDPPGRRETRESA